MTKLHVLCRDRSMLVATKTCFSGQIFLLWLMSGSFEFWNVNLLIVTDFGCPEVNLCGWQDLKIQLLTNVGYQPLCIETSCTASHAGEGVYMFASTSMPPTQTFRGMTGILYMLPKIINTYVYNLWCYCGNTGAERIRKWVSTESTLRAPLSCTFILLSWTRTRELSITSQAL